MPKLNGYEACRRIREEPWGKGILIAAVTGWGQEEDKRRSQEAGFDHHLIKPVGLAAIDKLLVELEARSV
jgi:CheY-like chemotaxis protein